MGFSWKKSADREPLKNWPKDGEGNPEEPVFLKHCSCVDLEDEMTINLLLSADIPSLRQYSDGTFGKVILGMSGYGADIFVPASLLEDAQALLMEGVDEDELYREIQELDEERGAD